MSWLARSDWQKRTSEFGALEIRDDEVRMEFLPKVSERLWTLWSQLSHPKILVPADPGWLHYAALDWAAEVPNVAAAAATLTRVYDAIASSISHAELAWFAAPIVFFDLEGVMRLAFHDARPHVVPPELFDRWPHCDDRALVFVIGRVMRTLGPTDAATSDLATRCLEREPAKRPSMSQLHAALDTARDRSHDHSRDPRPTWDLIERGLGFLYAGAPHRARHTLERAAIQGTITARRASALLALLPAPAADPPTVPPAFPPAALARLGLSSWPPPTLLAWRDVRSVGEHLEHERDFVSALRLYKHVQPEDDAAVAAHALARARCRHEVGDFDRAVGLARLVLARDAGCHDARAIEARALLAVKLHTDALAVTDAWLALAPDDARAHYARGKALLGLRRLVEARDAFARACSLAPRLVEAMWLRTLVERSLATVRATTGTAITMAADLPPGLLRDALLAGRIDDAIALLERAPDDDASQLRLGRLFSYAGRFEDALRVFEARGGDAALEDRARALLDLGRTDEALALFERLGPNEWTNVPR